MILPPKVSVVEVGPRDGLQNEPFIMDTPTKISLIKLLLSAGIKRIEATSFVRADRIPQLGDAEEVIRKIIAGPDVRISALVPNYRGYERARDCGVKEINLVVSASQTHNLKNVNRTIEESCAEFSSIAEAARRSGIMVRGSVAMSFGCPYEGKISPGIVLQILTGLKKMGCFELVLADTVGCATPVQVYSLFSYVMERLPGVGLAAHFHDTGGRGMANVIAAMQAGVTVFDSAVGGLGGCPYAPGAPGNIATESLVETLTGLGIETGINTGGIAECVDIVRHHKSRHCPDGKHNKDSL